MINRAYNNYYNARSVTENLLNFISRNTLWPLKIFKILMRKWGLTIRLEPLLMIWNDDFSLINNCFLLIKSKVWIARPLLPLFFCNLYNGKLEKELDCLSAHDFFFHCYLASLWQDCLMISVRLKSSPTCFKLGFTFIFGMVTCNFKLLFIIFFVINSTKLKNSKSTFIITIVLQPRSHVVSE